MAFCNACGTEVPEQARFCQNCGANLMPTDGIPAMTPPTTAPQPPYPPPYASAYGSVPPSYPPPPYAVVPGYTVPPTKSGKAVAGFWIGIASIPCCIFSWIGVIVGITGLVFGLLGWRDTHRFAAINGESPARYGRTQATIGIICAVVGIAASVAVLVYLLNHLERYGIKFSG